MFKKLKIRSNLIILGLLFLSLVFFSISCSHVKQNFLKQKINAVNEAKQVQCSANLRQVDSAVAAYYVENEAYPQNLNELNDIDENAKKCPIDDSDIFLENVGDKVIAKCSHGHTSESSS